MFCGFCGKEIRNEAVFCPFCGNPVKKGDTFMSTSSPAQPSDHLSDETPNVPPTQEPIPVQPRETQPAKAEKPVASPAPAPVTAPQKVQDGAYREASPRLNQESLQQPQPKASNDLPAGPSQTGRMDRAAGFAPTSGEDKEADSAVQRPGKSEKKPASQGPASKEQAPRRREVPNKMPAKGEDLTIGGKPQRGGAAEKGTRRHSKPERPAPKKDALSGKKTANRMKKSRKAPEKRDDRTFFVQSLVSKLSLLLIPLAAYLPYCRIVYSAERTADMPLWKLILGGTYVMGSMNPLEFTLKAHPILAVLLLVPLLAVLISCFKRTRAKVPVASVLLLADGAALLYLNARIIRDIRNIVANLSLETFEQRVVSMNGLVIRWVMNAVAGKTSMEGTFYVTRHLGYWLILLVGGLMLALGIIGLILWMKRLFTRKAPDFTQEEGIQDDAWRTDDIEDDVPELTEDML